MGRGPITYRWSEPPTNLGKLLSTIYVQVSGEEPGYPSRDRLIKWRPLRGSRSEKCGLSRRAGSDTDIGCPETGDFWYLEELPNGY